MILRGKIIEGGKPAKPAFPFAVHLVDLHRFRRVARVAPFFKSHGLQVSQVSQVSWFWSFTASSFTSFTSFTSFNFLSFWSDPPRLDHQSIPAQFDDTTQFLPCQALLTEPWTGEPVWSGISEMSSPLPSPLPIFAWWSDQTACYTISATDWKWMDYRP